MIAEMPVVLGAQVPRIRVVPDGDPHPLWDEVVDFVRDLGVTPDDWQSDLLYSSLLRKDGLWAAFTVAACVPRQNGKNGVVEIRELAGALLLGEAFQIHTAHEANTADIGFQRLDDLIDANAWLSAQVRHIWRANGKQSIEFMNGHKIRFRTRTRGGGRGFSGSPVFFDEAMYLPEVSLGAILPVISAQPDPQVWYTGSAVDQMVHEDGVAFARVRNRALTGDHDRLLYFEWGLDVASPDLVEPEQAADPVVQAATNPAFGIRITEEYLRAEIRELDARTFAVERLGVWDPPPTDGTSATVIDLELWKALVDESSRLLDPVCLTFDVSPDRSSASIAAAGKRADGLAHVEIVDRRAGTGWVAARLAALCDRHEVSSVSCDGAGPASTLVPAIEALGVTVEVVLGPEYASACGFMFDIVAQSGLRHLGSMELTAAIKGAVTRQLGEKWAWARRKSNVDITPLVAVTLALWGSGLGEKNPYESRGLVAV